MLVEIHPILNNDGSARFFVCYVNGDHIVDCVERAKCWSCVDNIIDWWPELLSRFSKN